MLLRKSVLKIYSKFRGKHPCLSVISIKLLCNFIEITLRHEVFSCNFGAYFQSTFSKNTSGWLLLTEKYHIFRCRTGYPGHFRIKPPGFLHDFPGNHNIFQELNYIMDTRFIKFTCGKFLIICTLNIHIKY